ncbi:MAG TPA: SgcJ/EcaC family oxidoreductase [Candidatus Binataceae bacterium]|nr:SgcJ/EcaC family oxidoreductase [Candidatus Binataceae bacterium]
MKPGVAFAHLAIVLTTFAILFVVSATANADAVAEAKTVSDAFTKAFGACDVPAVMDLYETDAVVIWPGQGEFAIGKPAFEKIVKGYCSTPSGPSIKVVSSDARQVGLDHIIHFGQLDVTMTGPDGKPATVRVRTSELLHKSHGKWLYEVDHASAGLPPPPAANGGKTQ